MFYVGHYDPRVPHPRKLISKNYHIISNNPVVSKLFPRGNLVSGTKRLPNLSEILSPTVPRKRSTSDPGDGSDGRPGDSRDVSMMKIITVWGQLDGMALIIVKITKKAKIVMFAAICKKGHLLNLSFQDKTCHTWSSGS